MSRLVPPACSWLSPSRVCLSAWPAPVVARSAFRAGSLFGFFVRPSSRAWSGAVLVCCFSRAAAARAFAARWSARCRVAVVVRAVPGPGPALWSVSVPVPPSSPLPALAFPGARSVLAGPAA